MAAMRLRRLLLRIVPIVPFSPSSKSVNFQCFSSFLFLFIEDESERESEKLSRVAGARICRWPKLKSNEREVPFRRKRISREDSMGGIGASIGTVSGSLVSFRSVDLF